MKKLLSILLLFVTFGAMAQTYDTLPTGSKPYGNFYLGPDGNLVFGNAGLKFRVIGTKKRVDSLLALKADALDPILNNTVTMAGSKSKYVWSTPISGTGPNSFNFLKLNYYAANESTPIENWSVNGGSTTIRNLQVTESGPVNTSSAVNIGRLESSLLPYQLISEKGSANGYAGLDGSGKVPLTQINDALLGAVNYRGTYNAATNVPAMPAAQSSNKGYYYIVSTAGTQFGLEFRVGDWIISNGSAYGKVSSSSDVESVNGKKGVVNVNLNDVLTAGNTSSQPISVGAIAAGSGSITSAPTQPTNILRLDDVSTGKTIGANTTGNANSANGLKTYSFDGTPITTFDFLFGRNAAQEIRPVSANDVKTKLATSFQDVTTAGSTTDKITYHTGNVDGTAPSSGIALNIRNTGIDVYNHSTSSASNLILNASGGNVGIGTANPTQKLDVNGNIQTQAQFFNGTNTTGIITPMDGNVLIMEAFNKTNSVKYPIALNPYGGNVGIGTTNPTHKLTVNGSIVSDVPSGTGAYLIRSLGNNKWELGTSSDNLYFYNYVRGGIDLLMNANGDANFTANVNAGNTVSTTAVGNPTLRLNSTFSDAGNRNWDILTNLSAWGDFDIRRSASAGATPTVSTLKIKNDGTIITQGSLNVGGKLQGDGTNDFYINNTVTSKSVVIQSNGVERVKVSSDGVRIADLIGGNTRSVQVAADGKLIAATAVPVSSGTYTPATSDLSNISGVGTVFIHTYNRVNDMITVYGKASVTKSATGAAYFEITLPIASNFTAYDDLLGFGVSSNISTGGSCLVETSITNKRARISISPTTDLQNAYNYSFTYRIK